MNVTLQYILKCDPATLTKRSAARARRDDPVLVDAEWVARRVQPRCFAAGRLGLQRREDLLARRVGRGGALEPGDGQHALAPCGDDRRVHARAVERRQQLALLERAGVARVAEAP